MSQADPPNTTSRLVLQRTFQLDLSERRYRIVTRDGYAIGRLYDHRARFGGHHKPVRNGFRFEFSGLPTRDPIVRRTWAQIRQAIEEGC